MDDPLNLAAEHDRVHPWENPEWIATLVIEAHEKLTVLMAAMESEIRDAVERHDPSPALVGMMAWEYGPVAALVTDIEMSYGDVLPHPA